jgi:hypothetical protein
MSADAGKRSIEAIVQLILDGREDEAHAAISLDSGEAAAQELNFFKTPAPRGGAKRDGNEKPGRGKRDSTRLTNLYKLSVFLSDREDWDKALTALARTIKFSEDMDDVFYLGECRFRKALCHKMLGQPVDMMKEKAMISADRTFFIGTRLLGIGDLDY